MFGHSTIHYTAAEETVPLAVRPDSSSAANGDKKVSLLDLAKSAVAPCQLNPLLFNGHLQTMWAGSGQAEDVPIHYKRRVFKSDDTAYPGQFAVDFVIQPPEAPLPRDKSLPPRTHNFTEEDFEKFSSTEDDSPMVIVMHGISGGSHEQYLRHMLRPLVSKEGGWSGCVINARGCAWSKITSPRLFNARATWDVRQLINWLKETWPKRKLYAIGFSLGANILCNYLGEEGDKCQVEAAVLVGNPWNLDVANSALESSWMGLNVYLASMGTWMKKLFERNMEELSKNPDIDVAKVMSSKYLFEWDRHVQCPIWGYPTEHAYYRDASSVDAVFNIRVPVLALHAKDDPIIADIAVPYEAFKKSPYVVMCATDIGGHLGWFEIGGGRWFTTTACQFFQKIFQETDGVKATESANGNLKSTAIDETKPFFDPMRRRLHFRE